MSKKTGIGIGVAALAAGAGAAAVAAKNHKKPETKTTKKNKSNSRKEEYRNTELGKHEKNSIIPMVTTRHLPVRKSRKVSMRRMPTS